MRIDGQRIKVGSIVELKNEVTGEWYSFIIMCKEDLEMVMDYPSGHVRLPISEIKIMI
jgi:hypothetical protein